jgi:hypothetical protein
MFSTHPQHVPYFTITFPVHFTNMSSYMPLRVSSVFLTCHLQIIISKHNNFRGDNISQFFNVPLNFFSFRTNAMVPLLIPQKERGRTLPNNLSYMFITYPLCVPCMSLICPFNVPYMSFTFPYVSHTCPLHVPYMPLTCPLHVSFMSL